VWSWPLGNASTETAITHCLRHCYVVSPLWCLSLTSQLSRAPCNANLLSRQKRV